MNNINNANEFLSIKTVDDFCDLIGISRFYLVGLFYSNYNEFYIKRRKKIRKIQQPEESLMEIQKIISKFLNAIYFDLIQKGEIKNSFGFIKSYDNEINKSIVTNAVNHVRKEIVGNIDIKDFFITINVKMVESIFKKAPFNFNDELAYYLTYLLTWQGKLPVGAPTSPILSNFIMSELDKTLSEIQNLTYSRYADDLTFSSNNLTLTEFKGKIEDIIKIIEKQGFTINENKTSIKTKSEKQIVTGIIVNTKPNVDRRYIRTLRAIFHSIKKYGYTKTVDEYIKKYKDDFYFSLRGYFMKKYNLSVSQCFLDEFTPNKYYYFKKSILSKIFHIQYIKGKDDIIFIKYLDKFNDIINQNKYEFEEQPVLPKDNNFVYVTNATARSIVYYAYIFLKESGYSNTEIKNYNNAFLDFNNKLSFEKMLLSFQEQSAYFISLYSYMTQNKRFDIFVQKLEERKILNQIFNFEQNVTGVMHKFNRKIYHSSFYCNKIINDYNENGKFHKNTGIFFERDMINNSNLYMLNRSFLENLNMRACLVCDN